MPISVGDLFARLTLDSRGLRTGADAAVREFKRVETAAQQMQEQTTVVPRQPRIAAGGGAFAQLGQQVSREAQTAAQQIQQAGQQVQQAVQHAQQGIQAQRGPQAFGQSAFARLGQQAQRDAQIAATQIRHAGQQINQAVQQAQRAGSGAQLGAFGQGAFARLGQQAQVAAQQIQQAGRSSQSVFSQLMQLMTQTARAGIQAFGGLDLSLTTFIDRMSSLQGVLASLGAIKAFTFILGTGTQIDSLTRSFNAFSGSARAGAENLGFVRDLANRIGIEFVPAAESFKNLAAAARGTVLAGRPVQEIFANIATTGATMGLSTQRMTLALSALSQMLSRGTVSMEELRQQLGEHLPGAFQSAARAMGVSTSELQKMIEQGEVMATDFLPRFARQVAQDLGASTEAASARAAASFARLTNAIVDLGNALASGGVLSGLAAVIETLLKVNSAFDAAIARIARFKSLLVTPGQERGAQQQLQGLIPPGISLSPAQETEALRVIQRYESLRQKLEQLQKAPTLPFLPSPVGRVGRELEEAQREMDALRTTFLQMGEEANQQVQPFQRQAESVRTVQQELAAVQKASEGIRSVMNGLNKDLAQVAANAELSGKAFDLPKERSQEIAKAFTDISKIMSANKITLGDLPKDMQAQIRALQGQLEVKTPRARRDTSFDAEDVGKADALARAFGQAGLQFDATQFKLQKLSETLRNKLVREGLDIAHPAVQALIAEIRTLQAASTGLQGLGQALVGLKAFDQVPDMGPFARDVQTMANQAALLGESFDLPAAKLQEFQKIVQQTASTSLQVTAEQAAATQQALSQLRVEDILENLARAEAEIQRQAALLGPTFDALTPKIQAMSQAVQQASRSQLDIVHPRIAALAPQAQEAQMEQVLQTIERQMDRITTQAALLGNTFDATGERVQVLGAALNTVAEQQLTGFQKEVTGIQQRFEAMSLQGLTDSLARGQQEIAQLAVLLGRSFDPVETRIQDLEEALTLAGRRGFAAWEPAIATAREELEKLRLEQLAFEVSRQIPKGTATDFAVRAKDLRQQLIPEEQLRATVAEIEAMRDSIALLGENMSQQFAPTFAQALQNAQIEFAKTTLVGQSLMLVAEGIGTAFSQSFEGVIQGTKSVSDAFKDMVQSILLSIAQLLIQRGIQDVLNLALAALPGGGGAPVADIASAIGGAIAGQRAFQEGGIVRERQIAQVGEVPEAIIPLKGGAIPTGRDVMGRLVALTPRGEEVPIAMKHVLGPGSRRDHPLPVVQPRSLKAGGIVSRPLVAQVGDAGAGNPEVVAPLRELGNMLRHKDKPVQVYNLIVPDKDEAERRAEQLRQLENTVVNIVVANASEGRGSRIKQALGLGRGA
jgi:tape measure domain-containing protein